jgi:hypothetical protein
VNEAPDQQIDLYVPVTRIACKMDAACSISSMTKFIISGHVPNTGLFCSSCQEQFSNPWDLVLHVQESHGIQIFEEGDGPVSGDVTMALHPNEVFIKEQ